MCVCLSLSLKLRKRQVRSEDDRSGTWSSVAHTVEALTLTAPQQHLLQNAFHSTYKLCSQTPHSVPRSSTQAYVDATRPTQCYPAFKATTSCSLHNASVSSDPLSHCPSAAWRVYEAANTAFHTCCPPTSLAPHFPTPSTPTYILARAPPTSLPYSPIPQLPQPPTASTAKMPINWQDKAVQDRLLTAVIASVDNTVRIPIPIPPTHPPNPY
jgi:hypothetical protein